LVSRATRNRTDPLAPPAGRRRKGRRNGSPRSSPTSVSICFGRRSSRSNAMPQPVWTA
jgi:hypothetical protein